MKQLGIFVPGIQEATFAADRQVNSGIEQVMLPISLQDSATQMYMGHHLALELIFTVK